jgi:hypothetical protein
MYVSDPCGQTRAQRCLYSVHSYHESIIKLPESHLRAGTPFFRDLLLPVAFSTFATKTFSVMPSVLRPNESVTAGTNSPRGANQKDRCHHISEPGSNVPNPQSIPINGTAINGTTSSGHIASKPTSGQYTEATPTSGAMNSSMVQAVTTLDEEEIAAINSELEYRYPPFQR